MVISMSVTKKRENRPKQFDDTELLLKPGETVNTDRYRQQMISLNPTSHDHCWLLSQACICNKVVLLLLDDISLPVLDTSSFQRLSSEGTATSIIIAFFFNFIKQDNIRPICFNCSISCDGIVPQNSCSIIADYCLRPTFVIRLFFFD